MEVIYHYKQNKPVNRTGVEKIMNNLLYQKNCDCLILGCTELSCIDWMEDLRPYCVDPMLILAERSIQLSGKKVKQRQQEAVHSAVLNQ